MPEIVVPPAALLVIDVVEYTANSRFPSSCQTVRDALPHIARMLQAARQAGLPVFYSRGGLRYYTNKSSRLPDVVRGSWWATVTDAFSHNYRVIIANEAVADRRIEAHRYHIAEMHGRLGWVVGVDAAVALMG